MKKLLIALAAVMITAASYGQGQVVFGNLGGGVNAPVTVLGSDPLRGPGADWSAQLFLQPTPGGALTALTPVTTFRAAGTGAAAIADRYWNSATVDVPVAPGTDATFVVRAWQTSLGSFDAAALARGESASFTATVGGGTLPPGNLLNLQAFTVEIIPEPSVLVLGALGAAALLFRRRK